MFRDLWREAYGAMQHNRRRTALTMLGMGWGIATVVMLLAYGRRVRPGLRQHLCQLWHQACDRSARAHYDAGGRTKIGNGNPLHPGGRGNSYHQSSADHPYHARGE